MSELKTIEPLILTLRGQKVILDADLAEAYGAETKRLNEQVKRNADRFPEDFMFQLTRDEWNILKSQIAISISEGVYNQVDKGNRSQIATGSQKHRDPHALPRVFTEHGAIMAVQGRTGFQPVFENFYAEKDRLEACPTLGNNYENET